MTDTRIRKQDQAQATDPNGPTGALATWAAETTLDGIPDVVLQRAKHLLLDGIGCLLVGSHLEWSSLGVTSDHRLRPWRRVYDRRLGRQENQCLFGSDAEQQFHPRIRVG